MTPSELNDMKRSDKWIMFIFYLLFVLLIIFIFFGYKIAKIMSAPFWGMIGYIALNFVVVLLAVPLQGCLMNMDVKPSDPVQDINFGQYAKKFKYWLIVLSSFGIVGVCCSMKNYEAFKSL